MEETNTFIPHESNTKTTSKAGNVFFFITLALFAGSIAFGGIAYVLRVSAEKKLASYEDSLVRSKERFNQGLPVRSIEQFDTRLKAAKDLLAKHKSFSGLFDLIERITLKNVQIVSFSYVESDNGRKNLVKIVAKAPDYKTIAEESEQFSLDQEAKRYITDVVFSNLSVDTKKSNMITFEISFTVDSDFLAYSRYVNPASTSENGSGLPNDASLKVKNQ